MAKCIGCNYYPKCDEMPFDESGCPDFRGWIPVSERLPDKKGEYLVTYHPCHWDAVHDAFTFVGVDTFRGKTSWAKNKFQRVTHWMPLPEPPKEE